MFRQFLSYNAKLNGTKIIKTSKFYQSSILCHICVYKKIDLLLKDRSWICPICNTVHNRDENATINILKEGLHLLEVNNNSYVIDNTIIYNATNPGTLWDSSLIQKSLVFLNKKHQLQTSNS